MWMISMLIWAVCAYKIAKRMRDHEGVNVKPINYAILSALFGFILSVSVLVEKYARMKNKTVLGFCAICVAIIMTIVNLLAIL